jgi:hypothetical protein
LSLIRQIGKELTYIAEKINYHVDIAAAWIFAGGIGDYRIAHSG